MRGKHLYSELISVILPIILLFFTCMVLLFAAYLYEMKTHAVHSSQDEIARDIEVRMQNYLSYPHVINRLNQAYFTASSLTLSDIAIFQNIFYEQLKIFNLVNLIALGTADGEYVEAQRLGPDRIRVGEAGRRSKGNLNLWSTGSDGEKEKLELVVEEYNPVSRPWYQASLEAGKTAWSDVYLFSSSHLPAISGNQPLYYKGEMGGVLSTTITLDGISRFLTELMTSPGGQIVIYDDKGLLIASSLGISLVDDSLRRIPVSEVHSSVTRKAFEKNSDYVSTGSHIREGHHEFSFRDNREMYWVKYVDLDIGRNLMWSMLVIIPESDFSINQIRLTFQSVLMLGLTLFCTILLIMQLSRRIMKPVSELTDCIEGINFHDSTISEVYIPADLLLRKDETGVLSNTFATLMHQLNRSFRHLEKSRTRYRTLVEDTGSIVMRLKPDGTITYCNAYGLDLYGFSKSELIGSGIQETVLNFNKEVFQDIFSSHLNDPTEDSWINENLNIKKNGEKIWVLWSNRILFDDEGNVSELLTIGQDISYRKEAEEQLSQSLEEKSILLREIHHRVKNNLQVIISLFNLQMRNVDDENIIISMNAIKDRIKSMAIVHEMLYTTTSLSTLDFRNYIINLSKEIIPPGSLTTVPLNLEMDCEPVFLNIDQSITAGLILNELMTNACKYAFEGRAAGTVKIHLNEDRQSRVRLRVTDNGIGISRSNGQKGSGLGTMLVNVLADQLSAEISVTENNGTSVELVFTNNMTRDVTEETD